MGKGQLRQFCDWMVRLDMRRCNMWICYLIPIVIHLLFLPFWFLAEGGTLSLIEILIGTVGIPIYLIFVSYKLVDDLDAGNFFLVLFIMLVVTIFGILIHYFNWGITTGNLLKPDSATVLIIKSEILIASIIVIVGWIVAYMIKHRTL